MGLNLLFDGQNDREAAFNQVLVMPTPNNQDADGNNAEAINLLPLEIEPNNNEQGHEAPNRQSPERQLARLRRRGRTRSATRGKPRAEENIDHLSVAQLKDELRARDLLTAGKKPQLRQRLRGAIEDKAPEIYLPDLSF